MARGPHENLPITVHSRRIEGEPLKRLIELLDRHLVHALHGVQSAGGQHIDAFAPVLLPEHNVVGLDPLEIEFFRVQKQGDACAKVAVQLAVPELGQERLTHLAVVFYDSVSDGLPSRARLSFWVGGTRFEGVLNPLDSVGLVLRCKLVVFRVVARDAQLFLLVLSLGEAVGLYEVAEGLLVLRLQLV